MKLKLRDVVSAKAALEELLAMPMTAKLAFAVAYNARHINAVLTDFDKARIGLAETCGEKVEGGFTIKPENQVQFQAELNELLDAEVDVDIRVVTEEQLEACESARPNFVLTPATVYGAWFMFASAPTPEPVVS